MSDVEETVKRMAAIVDELAALPDGPSPERFRLLQEQDALRAHSARFAASVDAERTTESLAAELEALRQQRAALVKSTGGYITGDSADSAGRVGAALAGVGDRAGSAAPIERLTVRISQIEDVLASRNNNQEA